MQNDPRSERPQALHAPERANHWVVGISFILLALSGLAFFHPAFFPLTQLFGGGDLGAHPPSLSRGADGAVLPGHVLPLHGISTR